MQKLKLTITIGAIAVAAVHVLWPKLAIDAITLGLAVIALIPWLSPLVKSVELPGGVKVELKDIKGAADKMKKAGLLKITNPPINVEQTFLQIAQHDPNLALAGLRIEIERRLVALCERNAISTKNRSLTYLLKALMEKNILTTEQNDAISDLTSLLNSATHGALVDPAAAKWALDIAPELLESLSRIIASTGPTTFLGEQEPKFPQEGDFWVQN